MPTFSVDIQETNESTYQVEADSPEEAEEIALRLHGEGEQPCHEEMFNAQVTNCEEIG